MTLPEGERWHDVVVTGRDNLQFSVKNRIFFVLLGDNMINTTLTVNVSLSY